MVRTEGKFTLRHARHRYSRGFASPRISDRICQILLRVQKQEDMKLHQDCRKTRGTQKSPHRMFTTPTPEESRLSSPSCLERHPTSNQPWKKQKALCHPASLQP